MAKKWILFREIRKTPLRSSLLKMQGKERHVNTKNSEWNVAIVHFIWERGSEENICSFIRELKRNAKATDIFEKFIVHSINIFNALDIVSKS